MNYHPDDFLSLIEEVEQQGGAHLSNEVCKPDIFRLNLPIDDEKPSGPKASRKLATTGCRRRAKFLVPLLSDEYVDEVNLFEGAGAIGEGKDFERREWREPTEDDFDFDKNYEHQALMGDGTPQLAKVCAVDDAMGLWPRFSAVMTTGESFQE
jgi:hypothetical protein